MIIPLFGIEKLSKIIENYLKDLKMWEVWWKISIKNNMTIPWAEEERPSTNPAILVWFSLAQQMDISFASVAEKYTRLWFIQKNFSMNATNRATPSTGGKSGLYTLSLWAKGNVAWTNRSYDVATLQINSTTTTSSAHTLNQQCSPSDGCNWPR